MTESEWLQCTMPPPMLLEVHYRGKSYRKVWLFGCACFRSVWDHLPSHVQSEVAIVEDAVDQNDGHFPPAERRTDGFHFPHNVFGVGQAAVDAAGYAGAGERPTTGERRDAEWLKQADFLRDIFGNPFRPVALDPAWRTGTVTSVAEVIYAERAFDRLPILADALEDAGCTSADVLEHCRGPGPHARGCWVVDLALGKE